MIEWLIFNKVMIFYAYQNDFYNKKYNQPIVN